MRQLTRPAAKSSSPFDSAPARILGAAAESVLAVRGDPERLREVIYASQMPMTLYDDERRYVEANRAAQLMARVGLEDMRRMRLDDFTPPDEIPEMEAIWAQMRHAGWVAGPRKIDGRNGAHLEIVYWGLANAAPGLHLFAFAPTHWSAADLEIASRDGAGAPGPSLTPREHEVLRIAAEGLSGPQIAERLVVSPATVKTHFSNIYEKLSVSSRAAAVAKAMRLGMIE